MVVELLGGHAGFAKVADLLVVSDNDAFGFEFRRSLHGNVGTRRIHSDLLVRQQLSRGLSRHAVVFYVDGIAEVANLGRILQVVRHCHLGRNGRLALNTFDNFAFRLLAARDIVKSLGHGWIHALVTHLLQSSLLRPRRILK